MSGNDRAARIHKKPLLASIISLFVITIVVVCARLVIRIRYQKTLSVDDGFLLFGVACLIAAMGILFTLVDQMYLLLALLTGYEEIVLPGDFVSQLLDFQKWSFVCMILLWFGICAVKFSFLFLFRKLIDRIRWMIVYWWFVTVFCVLVWLNGIVAFVLPCPWFYSSRSILVIPVRLIWQIQIPRRQKIGLGLTLCLTIILIAITLIRASGLKYRGIMDSVWSVYWQFISTEVGLILTSLAAFRTLFVAHAVRRQPGPAKTPWYTYRKQLLRQSMQSWTWRRWRSRTSSEEAAKSSDSSNHQFRELVEVPNGTMTGLGSFISGRGRGAGGISGILGSRVPEEDEENGARWDAPDRGQIRVHHDITMSQSVNGAMVPGVTNHATGGH